MKRVVLQQASRRSFVRRTLSISAKECQEALREWCDGVIKIGKVYAEGGDYRKASLDHVRKTYGFDCLADGNQILFKPTLGSDVAFRSDVDEFVSYFAGAGVCAEDKGFALKPWSSIRFDVHGCHSLGDTAIVSGPYWFKDVAGDETKVEFSLAFVRSPHDGKLKIVLHHSSLPYTPPSSE